MVRAVSIYRMKTIELNEANHDSVLEHARELITQAGVIVMPTDTVYGLVCDARDEGAIRKMFVIKQRLLERVFPIFVKDIATARRYAYISDAKARFLDSIWPGAVTVVFRQKGKLPAILTGGQDTIGIRVPAHPFLLELLARLDFPLAQTSANISNEPPAKNKEEIERYFNGSEVQLDLIIDAGQILGASSTVIDFTGESPIIARSGLVSKQDLDRMLKDF